MNDWPQLSQFTHFDWLAVVIVTLSGLLSLWRGFVREALSLLGWVIAFVIANLAAQHLADLIGDVIANRGGRYIVAWSLLFVLTLIATSLSAKLLSRLISASGLGVLDRILGSVFGVLRGALIVSALVFVLRLIDAKDAMGLREDSQLMPQIDLLLGWSTRLYEDFKGMDIEGIRL
jgi:membrane protein required for colicin V production